MKKIRRFPTMQVDEMEMGKEKEKRDTERDGGKERSRNGGI